MGRFLIGAGILLVIAGIAAILLERVGIHLGRLPGDIRIEGKRGGFYFPVVTCIIVSVVLSLISWFFRGK
jgi:H+/Cl- antiporter ClcA